MLIDDLRGFDFHILGQKIKDAIPFKILEAGNDFLPPVGSNVGVDIPSYLPFAGIALCFTDKVIWYLQEKMPSEEPVIFIYAFEFRPEDLEDILQFTNEGRKDLPWVTGFQMVGAPDKVEGLVCKNYGLLKPDGPLLLAQEDMSREHKNEIVGQFYALQRFLRFLSCKNIKTELKHPPVKVQVKRRKKGKLPLVSFYTLELQIPTKESHGQAGAGAWTNRVHLCRGHMREYTAEAPLFGKLVGRYWIPPHARGNKKEGLIVKDYQLKETAK